MSKKNNVKKNMKQSLKIIFEYDCRYIYITIMNSILQGLIPVLTIVIMQKIINSFQLNAETFMIVLKWIGLFILLNVIKNICQSLYSYYSDNFKAQFTKHIDVIILRKTEKLSLRDFEDTKTYDIINRAQSQSGVNILLYVTQIMIVLQQMISIVGSIFVLIKFRWWIIVPIILVPIIRCIITYIIDQKWYQIRRNRTQEERKKWYINFLLMTGAAFKEIKLFEISQYLTNKYIMIANSIIQQDKKMNKKKTTNLVILDAIDWLINGFIYIYTFFQGYKKILLIGDVTAYIECINTLKSNTQSVFYGISEIIEQSLYINMLFEYLEIPENEEDKGVSIPLINKIELKNVSFKYNNDKYALKNLNLTMNINDHIAFVGENGCGKTTLIKLLLGLYKEYEGEILIDGIELRKINLSDYRKRISCVFQDYMKYETTIRENVAYGNVKKIFEDKIILDKINIVGLKERIERMTGIDELIGNWFGKENISVGEWQRLAIARALIKNCDLVFLDEPDASLDILKQKELINLYQKVIKNKGGIYISHKINYVHYLAKKIYIMSNGEIVEQGTHEELMAQNGLYYKLFQECNTY